MRTCSMRKMLIKFFQRLTTRFSFGYGCGTPCGARRLAIFIIRCHFSLEIEFICCKVYGYTRACVCVCARLLTDFKSHSRNTRRHLPLTSVSYSASFAFPSLVPAAYVLTWFFIYFCIFWEFFCILKNSKKNKWDTLRNFFKR